MLSDYDRYLFAEGTHHRAYEKLGAHLQEQSGILGTHFAVWAPNAQSVSVIGDFNGWKAGSHPLKQQGVSGVWEGFVPHVTQGALYKYFIVSNVNHYHVEKFDPYAFAGETRPRTASVVWNLSDYPWGDAGWMAGRAKRNALDVPLSIYEVHLGSWMRVPEEGNRWLTYREMASKLADYVHQMGFTHVEFLPVMEHPFDGSWGTKRSDTLLRQAVLGIPKILCFSLIPCIKRGSV